MNDNAPKKISANIIDVDAAIKELESDLDKDVNAKSLYKTIGINIMLIALNAQSELKKHIAPGPISIKVLKGALIFHTDSQTNELGIGQLLTLEGNIPHSINANERSVFLLTKSLPT